MRRLVSGKMIYEEGIPFPTPSTESRYFEELGVLVEPGSPRDIFRIAYELSYEDVRLMLVTHPHLDHLANAIAFPEAEVTRNPERDKYSEGIRRYRIRQAIRSALKLRIVESSERRRELEDDILVRSTDLHFPGHLVFIVKGYAFVGDSFPPIEAIKEKLSKGEKFSGRLARHMRDIAEHAELIITAHWGSIKPEEILEVTRFFFR